MGAMLPRFLLPLCPCLSVSHSPDQTNELIERHESLIQNNAIPLRLGSLQKSKEDTGVDLEEERRMLEDLRKEAAKKGGYDSQPLSKKQRRLQYVNELLSHNSDLKKQSLIKVINNLNKCGVECTLSTQGKGSHITLSVDGKKHTISSKMQMTHLREALFDSGVQFSVIENDLELHSDQTLKEDEIGVSELIQLLKSLEIDISELRKEQQQLKNELESQKESAKEMREAYLFCLASYSISDVIIHRSYGRTRMIWQIFDAVMADLPYWGKQWDFQCAVKKNLLRFRYNWGAFCSPLREIQLCSTKVLQTRAHYFDCLGALFEQHCDLVCPVSLLLDNRMIELHCLNQYGLIDEVDTVDHTLLNQGLKSFMDEHHRKPYLSEFRQILDASKTEQSMQIEFIFFNNLITQLIYKPFNEDMIPECQHILEITEMNPNDYAEYYELSIKGNFYDLTFDQCVQISELHEQCGCNIAQVHFGLAMQIASKMWDHDKDQALIYLEKLLKQTPFQNGSGWTSEKFANVRREFGEYLYNQATQKIRKMHDSKQYSAEPLIDIERSEKIYGPMWFRLKGFTENQMSITWLCLELGDHPRAIREAGRIEFSVESSVIKPWSVLFQKKFNFDMNGKETWECHQQWLEKVKRENAERNMTLVIALKSFLQDWSWIWINRANKTLEQMEGVFTEMENLVSEIKERLWIQLHYYELLREVHELKQQFDDYIKQAKFEAV